MLKHIHPYACVYIFIQYKHTSVCITLTLTLYTANMTYYVNHSCPSTHNPSLTFRQAAAMASISTSTRRCSSWAATFVAPWWTPPGAKDTRSRCATGCTCPTGTAASTPSSPSQVVAKRKKTKNKNAHGPKDGQSWRHVPQFATVTKRCFLDHNVPKVFHAPQTELASDRAPLS